MRRAILLLALLALSSCRSANGPVVSDAFASNWSREYPAYHTDTYIEDGLPTTNFNGDSVLVYDGATRHKAHILINWTVPALSAGEILDSVRIVATLQCQEGGYPGFTGARVHRVLRSVVLSQTTWQLYSTNNSWAAPGGTGYLDIDTSTNYSGAANGIVFELHDSDIVAFPGLSVMARGSGLKKWATDNLIGGSSMLMWDSYLVASGEIKFYSSWYNGGYPGPSLWLYGHTTSSTNERRRIMLDGD